MTDPRNFIPDSSELELTPEIKKYCSILAL